MDIEAELTALDDLVKRLSAHVTVDATEEWAATQKSLVALEQEAERLRLPTSPVREYAGRLRHHLGILLNAAQDDGHAREQHLRWAIGDIQAMRGQHAFGPVLDRDG